MKSRQDGKETAMYFDAKSGLVRGMKVMQDGPAGPQPTTITLKDWKPIGKVGFFHLVEMTGGQMDVSMRYTRIEINNVDREKLAVPPEVAELALKRANRPAVPQAARMSGEYKDGMNYVMRKIDQRIKELEGAG
jgi:hypothetical protein